MVQEAKDLAARTENRIQEAIHEYQTQSLTPESVNRFWQILWQVGEELTGHQLPVPLCDRNPEELEELRKEGRGVLLIPDEITAPEGLAILGGIFPMKSWFVRGGTTVVNDHNRNQGSCIDIEMSVDAPNTDTTEDDLKQRFKLEGRDSQRFAVYIVGSQFCKLLIGKYFDEGDTSSRLLGSKDKGQFIIANFNPSGNLEANSNLKAKDHNSHLGGRSEGKKKAA